MLAKVISLAASFTAMSADDFDEGDVIVFENGNVGCVCQWSKPKYHGEARYRHITIVTKKGWSVPIKYLPVFNDDYLAKNKPVSFAHTEKDENGQIIEKHNVSFKTPFERAAPRNIVIPPTMKVRHIQAAA